jgi:hypothetical protein
VIDPDEFKAYVERTCWSLYDGCACHELKGHDGLHHCGATICGGGSCDETWTDEQAEEWYRSSIKPS